MAILDFHGNAVRLPGYTSRVFNNSAMVNNVVTGTSLGDAFTGGGAVTWIGGAGDDRYYQVTNALKVVENANEGIDTVYVVSNYIMADNIENLEIGYADGVVGNSLANYMKGSTRAESFDGGTGNDVLTGGGGGDAFVFQKNSGYDMITDFHTGPADNLSRSPDTVRLTGYSQFTTFAQIKAALTQVGSDVVLKLDANNAIKFADTTVSAFTSDNFQLTKDITGLKTSFVDDFNNLSLWDGNNGGTWRTDYGWGNDRNAAMARTLSSNGEKQLFVDPTLLSKTTGEAMGLNPFSVKDGILTVHASSVASDMVDDLSGYKFTSGMLSTRNSFTQTYGYFEARMDIPAGQGVWPAFWLYTSQGNASELDIMEAHGGEVTSVATHDHSTGKDAPMGATIFTPDITEGFHNYGVMWTKETVTWYIDGVAVKSIATPPDMHGPMYMIVNLALDAKTAADFQGADMKVDYVRAYALDNLPAGFTNTVTGGGSNDHLSGTTGADLMAGGKGNDVFYVDHVGDKISEKVGEGTDTVRAAVNWTLGDNFEHLTLVGNAISGTGNDMANMLTGNALNNILTGGAGNDILNGMAGADRMIGGTGNDTYHVDNSGDVIVEAANEGTDNVLASADYTLSDNIEQLTLTGTAIRGTGNALANSLLGNDEANILSGGAGTDRLDGGKGADTLIGGLDNDTYIVDNVGDVVIEKNGEGWDMIVSTVDYTLAANVEQLSLSGTAVRGTSSVGGGVVNGNEIGNILTGGAGKDWLDGKAGDDRLSGGGGVDQLTGGAGRDTFAFEQGFGADVITDFKIGEDSIDWSALVSTFGVPKIADVGGKAVATFGANSITFNGLRAADLIAGKVFDIANPVGHTVVGESVTIVPAPVVPEPAPVVAPAPAPAPVVAPVPAPVITPVPAPVATPAPSPVVTPTPVPVVTPPAIVETVIQKLMLTGTAGHDVLVGGAGNDTLIGREGADTMTGGAGNDWYSVDHIGDVVIEALNGGTDTISASINHVLAANIENLVLTGNAISGTGNALDNSLIGNDRDNILSGGDGNDLLMGGIGADTMIGGQGNDSFYVDNVNDKVIELANGGWDQIVSSVDYKAADNVEQLSLSGTAVRGTAGAAGIYLNGNDIANILTGGEGRDLINGKLGDDIINGGGGDDRLTGGSGKDVFVFNGAFGRDTITDFKVGEDRIDWSALKSQYGDPVLKSVGADVVASFGTNSITLLGVAMNDVNAHHVFA